MQKPPFCTPKTILLHGKNHTFVLRICNIHRMNTLQTFRKISTFNYEIPNEHSAKYQRTPPKHPTYTPPGVGDRFIVPVSLHCQIRIFPLSNTYIHFIANGCPHLKIRIFKSPHTHFCSPFCGCIRICGRDKSAPTAANGLLITLLPNWNNVANTPQNIYVQPRNSQRTLMKTPNLHSARRRGRFIVPVSLHCQIRIFPLLNTYIRFIANGCPHLKIRIFKSPHTHFCSPFCGYIRICGHDKSTPIAANGLLITLLAD